MFDDWIPLLGSAIAVGLVVGAFVAVFNSWKP